MGTWSLWWSLILIITQLSHAKKIIYHAYAFVTASSCSALTVRVPPSPFRSNCAKRRLTARKYLAFSLKLLELTQGSLCFRKTYKWQWMVKMKKRVRKCDSTKNEKKDNFWSSDGSSLDIPWAKVPEASTKEANAKLKLSKPFFSAETELSKTETFFAWLIDRNVFLVFLCQDACATFCRISSWSRSALSMADWQNL